MPSQFPSVTLRVSSVALFLCCLVSTLAADEKPFPKPANSQEETIKPLTPEEALKALQLPPGFKATLFAAEPAVQQPIAMAWDERGRLWVAECYTYAESAKGFDKEQKDRIIILEDTDGDGKHDKRTVFWDKGDKLTSIEVGFGGVWALCAPNLLFIPDKNRRRRARRPAGRDARRLGRRRGAAQHRQRPASGGRTAGSTAGTAFWPRRRSASRGPATRSAAKINCGDVAVSPHAARPSRWSATARPTPGDSTATSTARCS